MNSVKSESITDWRSDFPCARKPRKHTAWDQKHAGLVFLLGPCMFQGQNVHVRAHVVWPGTTNSCTSNVPNVSPVSSKHLNLMYWCIIGLLGVLKHSYSLELKLVLKQVKNETNFEFLRKLKNLIKPKCYDWLP